MNCTGANGQEANTFVNVLVGPQPVVSTDTIQVMSPNGGESYDGGDIAWIVVAGGHHSDTGGIEISFYWLMLTVRRRR